MSEIFVIMEKDEESGALSGEVTSCEIEKSECVAGLYCVKKGRRYEAKLTLAFAGEIEDWQYDAIFDYYDDDVFAPLGLTSVGEVTSYAEPAWEFVTPFSTDRNDNDTDDVDELEKKLNKIIELHLAEAADTLAVIADKKDEYDAVPEV